MTDNKKGCGKKVLIASAKGAISLIPWAGPFLAEFLDLAKENVMDRRQKEWMALVNDKFDLLQKRIDELSSDEFYVSVVQKTSYYAMQAYQEEKRALFANIIYNAATIDLEQDRQMLFIDLLNHYTLFAVKLLDFLSCSHYHEDDYIQSRGMSTCYTYPAEEKFFDYLRKANPDFSDSSYVAILYRQLMRDGLVEDFDFSIPQRPNHMRKKRTTALGDAFLDYICGKE